jgi:hypothetical protein
MQCTVAGAIAAAVEAVWVSTPPMMDRLLATIAGQFLFRVAGRRAERVDRPVMGRRASTLLSGHTLSRQARFLCGGTPACRSTGPMKGTRSARKFQGHNLRPASREHHYWKLLTPNRKSSAVKVLRERLGVAKRGQAHCARFEPLNQLGRPGECPPRPRSRAVAAEAGKPTARARSGLFTSGVPITVGGTYDKVVQASP